MNIQHKETGNTGSFFMEENGIKRAEIVYRLSEGKMIIDHTEVDEELRGKNIGYDLVEKTVDHARTHQLKIVPVCKFAKAVFDKKPDFGDVMG